MENIQYKELSLDDINPNLLDTFNRYQKVTKCWQNTDGNWVLVDKEYTDDWDKNKKNDRTKDFSAIIKDGKGSIFGAFDDGKLIGFTVLLNTKFGTREQYIQLKYLHVSLEHRHRGIGKELFRLCVNKAKDTGTEKIYISANDSEETIKFYFRVGCRDALEINRECTEEEPFDRQLECCLADISDTS